MKTLFLLLATVLLAVLSVGCTSADPTPAASPAATLTVGVPRPTMPTRPTAPATYTVAIDVTVTNSTSTNLVRLQGVLTNAP